MCFFESYYRFSFQYLFRQHHPHYISNNIQFVLFICLTLTVLSDGIGLFAFLSYHLTFLFICRFRNHLIRAKLFPFCSLNSFLSFDLHSISFTPTTTLLLLPHLSARLSFPLFVAPTPSLPLSPLMFQSMNK